MLLFWVAREMRLCSLAGAVGRAADELQQRKKG